MTENAPLQRVLRVLNLPPQAMAMVRGNKTHSAIVGWVKFYQMPGGVLVAARITGLPEPSEDYPTGIFGFHIHTGARCSGTAADPFADALTHYNPGKSFHPNHAGDLPPLFGNNGYAFQVFFTNRFAVREILHKTVVIHAGFDDFTSQPAGNAGEKIACGEINTIASIPHP